MTPLQIACAGNLFTKPLACWSLLDWLLVVVPILVVVLGGATIVSYLENFEK